MKQEDPMIFYSEQGKIKISDDIIMTIARNAVKDIEGILSISGGFPGGVQALFNKNTATKDGVRIEKDEKSINLNLSLELTYGIPIPKLVEEAQKKVKEAVESMTEIPVNNVNIFVHDVKAVE
ncbi:MAG: Asp23/Gls24 family envelope stress response protein [Tindallia sp. MSAO_Bac2]|nr:MAG: Asp23/Gls24 family envelope stress response protein [Tindallia sp. MSAO_Bac2]